MLSVTCTASPSKPGCAAAEARPRPQLGGDVDQGAPLLLLHSEVCSRRFCTRGIIGVKVQLPETGQLPATESLRPHHLKKLNEIIFLFLGETMSPLLFAPLSPCDSLSVASPTSTSA